MKELGDLTKIGLTKGEIKVYDALLQLGESTRTALAKKSEISPSKIYDVANRLIEKGLVSSVKRNGILHFKAANPQRISSFIEQKMANLEDEKAVVTNLLPSLLARYDSSKADIDVEVFTGWEGLKSALLTLEDSMSKKDTSYVFGASIGKDPKQSDIFFAQHQKRIEKQGYKVNIIFNEDMRKRKKRWEYYTQKNKHEIRFLHQKTLTEIYIYKEYVCFIILLEKPIAINIKNRETVAAFTAFFKTLWKEAKE